MSTTTMPEAPAHARGRLRDYGWWQLRDYLINKGIATALINGLLLFVVWSGIRTAAAAARAQGLDLDPATAIDAAFPSFLSNIVLFGVLFATNGIVSEDRKFGYYRFYFSKPVSVVAFYAQKFAVHVVGLLLVAMLMLGVHALVLAPRLPQDLLPVLPMLIVGLGGIGFLLSAIFTLDWITLLAVYAAAQVGWALYGDDPGVRGLLVRGLPPVHELTAVYAAVTEGGPVPMEPVWWVFLYGLACFFLGLVVIARRKLATN